MKQKKKWPSCWKTAKKKRPTKKPAKAHKGADEEPPHQKENSIISRNRQALEVLGFCFIESLFAKFQSQ